MTTLTLRQFVDAIRKNGLPQARGQYFMVNADKEIIEACVLGQAAMNLNVNSANELNRWYYNLPLGLWPNDEKPDIVQMNDNWISLAAIAIAVEAWAISLAALDEPFTYVGEMGFTMKVHNAI